MSVQAGIWEFDGNPVNPESLVRLTQGVAEYGPDGETNSVVAEVGMLYRAFHTTSGSRADRQPFFSAAGNMITFDGRLDNRVELLELLGNHRSSTEASDVSIAAAAFDRWASASFAKFVGDWAMAVWIGKTRRLVLARDYIGIRPLFYHHSPIRVKWCSQLDPLALDGTRFTLCEQYIAGYLTGFPDADLTPYQEIRSVPPGGYVVIERAQRSAHTHWTFRPWAKTRYKSNEEYEEHFRNLFRQSVRRRLRADCPILAGLSGGLDSSAIVCMADEILHSEGTRVSKVDTFSFCDRDEPDEDDFRYFTKVEERRGRTGRHAELKGTGDSFPIALSYFNAVPGFGERQELKDAMSRAVLEGQYRVVLSGVGGDEFLGQAFNPRMLLSDLVLQRQFRELARSLIAWSLTTRQPWMFLLFETLFMFLPVSVRALLTPDSKLAPWIYRPFAKRHKLVSRTLGGSEGNWWWSPRTRDSYQTYLTVARQLTYFSQSTPETRYPYLDQTLVEFLISVPAAQLAQPGETRSLMRRALKNLLPPEILIRKTKSGAGRCIALTVRKHRDRLSEVLRSSVGDRLGYTEAACLRSALSTVQHGQIPLHVVQLFKAVSLEFWLRDVTARNLIA
jgi:asparagine synthase (glutamine-hydrolysing)